MDQDELLCALLNSDAVEGVEVLRKDAQSYNALEDGLEKKAVPLAPALLAAGRMALPWLGRTALSAGRWLTSAPAKGVANYVRTGALRSGGEATGKLGQAIRGATVATAAMPMGTYALNRASGYAPDQPAVDPTEVADAETAAEEKPASARMMEKFGTNPVYEGYLLHRNRKK